jgi:hypothetical protein
VEWEGGKQCNEEATPMTGDTHFHFPPLFFNLLVSRPMYVAMPRLCTMLVSPKFSLRICMGCESNTNSNGHSRSCADRRESMHPKTYWTPKSPVANTSIRFSPKQANISTLQRPRPRTATSFSISSSSLALTSIWALNSPEANFSASPEMYSALR